MNQTIVSSIKKPFLVLAPMDEVTDCVFRTIVSECAPPDIFFTEFVNVDGLQSPGRPKLLKKLQRFPAESNVIAQIWGLKPENFYKTTKELIDMGFVGVDINMGCPAKSEVKNGTCSALINNRPLAHEMIMATKQAVADMSAKHFSVSVKTRLGFSVIDTSWHQFLLEHELDMLTVHFRTRKEMSKVPAHWEYAAEIVALRDQISLRTKIVGNGDVESFEQAQKLAVESGVDGVMIGRGIFKDPYCFALGDIWANKSKDEKLQLLVRHFNLYQNTWTEGERKFETLKKFAKVYVNGFDGAAELRARVMDCHSVPDVFNVLKDQS